MPGRPSVPARNCILYITLCNLGITLPLKAAGDGQVGATAQEPGGGVLSGRVLVGDVPLDSGTVVLHRVSARSSGEVDSTGVGAGGAFELRLPEVSGDAADEVFFAAVRHQGVLYFGEAFTGQPETGGSYVIQAWPAIPAGPDAHARVQVRNVLVERLDPGPGWTIADYFELGNDAPATLVAGENGPTWSHALPPGAADFRVGQSDLPAESASLGDGRVSVSAPMPPGERVYLFGYTVAADRFTVPMEGTTGSMELLIREPAGEISVSGLANLPEVEMEGIRYRRFAGRGMAPSVVTVALGGGGGTLGSMPLAAILLALALAGAGALVAARSRSPRAPRPVGRPRRDLLIAVARLDEKRRAGGVPDHDYEERRARLLEALGE